MQTTQQQANRALPDSIRRLSSDHGHERDSQSPYDVSRVLREISEIDGLPTNRQALQLLEAVLAKVNPRSSAFDVVLDATQALQAVLLEVAA